MPAAAAVRSDRLAGPLADLSTPTELQLHLAGIGGTDPFILTIRQSVKNCEPAFATAMCGCSLQPQRVCDLQNFAHLSQLPDHLVSLGRLRVLTIGACMSLDCPRCHSDVSRRRGDRVKQRLDAGRRKGAVGETVFTIPPRLRGRMMDRATWRAYRRAAWRLLQKHAGARFGVACSHPIGDKNPDLFHPHIHFLWCGKPGFKGYLADSVLDAMRRDWAALLGARVVDLHHSYVKGQEHGKLFHRCRYIARSFPGFAAWCGSVAWFGDYPKGVVFRSMQTCPHCHQPVRVIGTATAADLDAYRLGIPPPIPRYMIVGSCIDPGPPDIPAGYGTWADWAAHKPPTAQLALPGVR